MQITLPDPLELENTDEILSFTAGPADLALWPLIRSAVLARLTVVLRHRVEGTKSCAFDAPASPRRNRADSFIRNVKQAFSWPTDRDILYISNKSLRHDHNGRPYNHWEQPTAELLGKRTIFVTTNGTQHFFDDNSGIEFRDIAPLYNYAYRLYRVIPKRIGTRTVENFRTFLTHRLDSIFGHGTQQHVLPGIVEKISPRLYIQTLEHYTSRYALQKSKIKVIFISTASYGNNIGIQSAATDIGIHTAELQHGAISPLHYAYNCAHRLATHKSISRYMPHYFLSYGTLWHDKIASPSRLYPMGNPFFSITTRNARQCMGKGILFALSDEYESLAPFISAAIQTFPDREIIVRPHPHCMRAFAASSIAKLTGCTLDTAKSIYETFERTETVISTGSTTLFEAAALGKRCLLKPSTLSTIGAWRIFTTIKTPSEMLDKLSSPDCCRLPQEQQKTIFLPQWESSYTDFISSISCPLNHRQSS